MDSNLTEINVSKSKNGRSIRRPTQCQICLAPALYSHFGVISCSSCQMFFKRNAERKDKKFRCRFDGHCQIEPTNRHLCSSCRLAKCFASGMQVELIRGHHPRRLTKSNQQIRPLNLLQADRSTLSSEQWGLLSNLVHCYDEYGQMATAQDYLNHQMKLPVKKRFQLSSAQQFMFSLTSASRAFYEKNGDFRGLAPIDRIHLVEKSMRQVCGLDAASIIFKSHLFNHSTFHQTIDSLYDCDTAASSIAASHHLHPDPTFTKLVLAILIFSTIDCSTDPNQRIILFQDIRSVIKIHDGYIELLWRYLEYKYGFAAAVRSCSNLLRSLFALIRAIDIASRVQQYEEMIESLIKQTETELSLNK